MNEGAVEDVRAVERSGKHIVVEFDPVNGEASPRNSRPRSRPRAAGEVTELPPIGEWVDCDAIEQLFDSHDSETELSVSFEFEEYQVFLSSIGRIVVTSGSNEFGV